MSAAVEIENLRFGYRAGVPVLNIPSWSVAAGERVFLHGPSGCGKTTLLSVLTGVLAPQAGRVVLNGSTDLAALGAAARDRYRGTHIGYIFQMFNLVPYLTARENILLPVRLHAGRRARVRVPAEELAGHLGIGELLDRKPAELSTGQQQRVAAARALIGAPELVIADEPTSSLDSDAREQFLELLFAEVKAAGATLVFVSHDQALAPLFDRAVSLRELNQAA
jgi:putative ABC transport system ATP-binding protein